MASQPFRDRIFAIPWFDFFRLRPYGDSLATPAVMVWLGFAWVIILLMASIEGIVWGLVGASIVPEGVSWLRPVAGLFLFLLIFAIIWIVDASLILSERPPLRARRWQPDANQGFGALLRWWFGLVVRVVIVAVSLYVTAPFLAKLIRADDIASYHQRQVEQYYAQRDATLSSQTRERTVQIESLFRERAQPLEMRIAQLNQSLTAERQRRAEIEAEYGPELEVLRRDLTEAQARVGNEILGREGRPEGRGPEARKWEANASRLAEQLAAKQTESDARTALIAQRIAEIEQELRTASGELQRLRQEQQTRVEQIAAEIAAQQVEALPPRLTFAARSKALHALRESPDESGVPHFETVEGFAQAALGVLFFALMALKLFEPPAVRAYFNETIQLQYRKYLVGGLADIPGFELPEDLAQRLNPVEFARRWQAYESDPASFYAERLALLEVREPLLAFAAQQSFEQAVLERRQDNLDDELEFARRRRERELTAYDQELALRTTQLQTHFEQEAEARRELLRAELATELKQAREDWARRKHQEEEDLRQRKASFEQAQEEARETLRLREKELEQLREQNLAAARQSEIATRQAHERQLAELDIKREREAHQRRLNAIREELARLRGLEAKHSGERQAIREAGRKLRESLDAAVKQLATLEMEFTAQQTQAAHLEQIIADEVRMAEAAKTQRKRFWSRGDQVDDSKRAREARRELKTLDKAQRTTRERLDRLREDLHGLEQRGMANAGLLREAEDRVASIQARILFYEDQLGVLICSNHDRADEDA